MLGRAFFHRYTCFAAFYKLLDFGAHGLLVSRLFSELEDRVRGRQNARLAELRTLVCRFTIEIANRPSLIAVA